MVTVSFSRGNPKQRSYQPKRVGNWLCMCPFDCNFRAIALPKEHRDYRYRLCRVQLSDDIVKPVRNTEM